MQVAKQWGWMAVGVLLVAACSAQNGSSGKPVTTPKPAVAKPSVTATTAKPWYDDYDPAHFATDVRRYAKSAGINPQLLMAILYNESYKPHDPEFERSWAKVDSNPAFGIANMHRAAFDDTKRGRDFAKRKWEQLPDDPALAIEAAAWHLHDLARSLPQTRTKRFGKDELLALGYNTGAGNMRKFAKGTTPGAQAQSYVDRLHDNWNKSGKAVGS